MTCYRKISLCLVLIPTLSSIIYYCGFNSGRSVELQQLPSTVITTGSDHTPTNNPNPTPTLTKQNTNADTSENNLFDVGSPHTRSLTTLDLSNLADSSGFLKQGFSGLNDADDSLKQRFSGLDGTGGPPKQGIAGLDGTGGPPKQDIAGLDGTGGPPRQELAGLDGTGGSPKPKQTVLVARGISERHSGLAQNVITLNGIHYRTTDATTIDFNGEVASINDLQPGLVLTAIGEKTNISGDLATVVHNIIYDNSVLGPVTSVSPDTKELIALGQQVIFSDQTIFGDGVEERLAVFKRDTADVSSAPGVVDVSGILNNDGSISATRIVLVDNQPIYEVTGIITSLNQHVFKVGAQLHVDFSQAQLVGFPSGELRDGMLVEVKIEQSQITNEFPDTAEAIAHTIIFKGNGNLDIQPDSLMSIQGSISEFEHIDDTTFNISGFQARLTDETEIIGGTLIDLLIASTEEASVTVTVDGTFSSQQEIIVSSLVIDKIIDRRKIIGANIETLNNVANEIVLADFNIPVVVSTTTQFIDSLSNSANTFTLSELQEGEYVEVWGHLASEDSRDIKYIANVVHRRPLDRALLQGNVSNIRGREFSLQGYRVVSTDARYTNEKGEPLTQEKFFSSLHNRFVEVQGIPTSNFTFTASHFSWASTAKHDVTYAPIIGIPDPIWGFNAHPILKQAPAKPENWVNNVTNFYYIDPSATSATDINNPFGNPQQPRASLPTSINPGSYIELHGEYKNTYDLTYHCTEIAPCWLRGEGDDKSANTRPRISGAFNIANSQHLYIENLNFHGGKNGGLNLEGNEINHIVIRNSSFKDRLHPTNSRPSALYINPDQGGQVHNIVIYDNHFENLGEWLRDDGINDTFHAIDLSLRNAPRATINDVWILENFCTHNRGSCIRLQTGHIDTLDQLHNVYIGRNRSVDNRRAGIDINRAADVIISQNIIKGGNLANGIVLREEKENVWVIFNEVYDSIFGIRQAKTLDGALGKDVYIMGNLIYDIAPNLEDSIPYQPKSYWNQGAAIALWHGNLDRYIIDNTIYKAHDGIIAMYRVDGKGELYYGINNNHAGEIHVYGNLISQKDNAEHNNFIEFPHPSLQNFDNVHMDYNLFVDQHEESYYGCWAFDKNNYKTCTNKRNHLAEFSSLAELQISSQSCQNCISVIGEDGSNDFVMPSIDPSRRNFGLQNGSIAIGKNSKHTAYDVFEQRYGLDIYVDFNGQPRHSTHPAVGAFEANRED